VALATVTLPAGGMIWASGDNLYAYLSIIYTDDTTPSYGASSNPIYINTTTNDASVLVNGYSSTNSSRYSIFAVYKA
jgi:hypothetical protein